MAIKTAKDLKEAINKLPDDANIEVIVQTDYSNNASITLIESEETKTKNLQTDEVFNRTVVKIYVE